MSSSAQHTPLDWNAIEEQVVEIVVTNRGECVPGYRSDVSLLPAYPRGAVLQTTPSPAASSGTTQSDTMAQPEETKNCNVDCDEQPQQM